MGWEPHMLNHIRRESRGNQLRKAVQFLVLLANSGWRGGAVCELGSQNTRFIAWICHVTTV